MTAERSIPWSYAFTAPDEDGNVQQYIAERDDRDIPFLDLSDRTMREADAFLQEKTYEEFSEPEIPMVEITMVNQNVQNKNTG